MLRVHGQGRYPLRSPVSEGIKQIRVRCSFCNKHAREVLKMIAGPDGVHICDECVRLCRNIIDEEHPNEVEAETTFASMRPAAIKAYPSHFLAETYRASGRLWTVAPIDDLPRIIEPLISRAVPAHRTHQENQS